MSNEPIDLDSMRRRAAKGGGQQFWMSVEELIDERPFRDLLTAEFPSAADIISDPQRRSMLKLMGASLLLAGLGACTDSRYEDALPYVNQPENLLPGVPKYYASAVTFDGYAQPIIATTYDGRPTKLDGNPQHPATRGRSDSFMQAAVLGLYDPERAKQPTKGGVPVTWGDVEREFADMLGVWTATRGRDVRIVIGPTTSPTLERQINALLTQYPQARLHVLGSLCTMRRDEAMQAAFGRAVETQIALENCAVIVSLDDDFLGPGAHQVRNALGWASRRGEQAPGAGRSRLHIAESIPGAAGVVASTRIAAEPSRMRLLARALSGDEAGLNEREKAWAKRARDELAANSGRGVVLCGAHLDPDIQVSVARINERLGNVGKTLHYTTPIHAQFQNVGDLSDLAKDIDAGKVDTLIMLDCNPAYTCAGALHLAELFAKVKRRICAGLYVDETAVLCQWHLPLAHALESWSDARAVDGTATVIQPVIRPLYATRNIHQIVDMLAGAVGPSPDQAVRATWAERFGNDTARWRKSLYDGFVDETTAPLVAVSTREVASPPVVASGDIEVVFRPDPTVWDGRFANIAWLQELPKPLSKVTWDNVIGVSPVLAAKNGLSNGDRAEVAVGGRSIEGPAFIVPGQALNAVSLYFGYGRRAGGTLATGIGYDANSLRPGEHTFIAGGTLRRADGRVPLATSQLHHRMDGFDFVREVTAKSPHTPKPAATPTLYPEATQGDNAWGMVIDLDRCMGCNACISACNVENNVAVVGKDQVERGREMLWLRVDRYYTGEPDDPRTFFQPVPCMHCEKAPCEMGCPVHATVHSPEGVNQMVYNRCIGTRTCSSYCPYKVRRFNWYDYRKFGEADRAAKNPDVTVRSRGVMEKCTYCTQRIQAAHVAADKQNRPIRDGEVVTACQQACPAQAITFGNIKDEASAVSKQRKSGRHYVLLEELGTRPRTTYLARWNDDDSKEEHGT